MSGKDLLRKIGILFYALLYKYCYLCGLFTLGALTGASALLSKGTRILQLQRRAFERRAAARLGLGVRRVQRALRGRRLRASSASASLNEGVRSLLAGRVRDGLRFLGRFAYEGCGLIWPVVRTAINLALPILGLVFLMDTVENVSARQYALLVHYAGEDIGYIADESVFDQAASEVLQKLQGARQEVPIDFSAAMQLVPVDAGTELMDPYTLSDYILSTSQADFIQAYGLYIDGDFVNAVTDRAPLLDLLSLMQDKYRTDQDGESVMFVRDVALREGLYPRGSVKNLSEINRRIGGEVRGQTVYSVVKGDSASLIAQKFDVPQAQIIANNPGILDSLLIGQEVVIERPEPYMSVKIQRVESYREQVPFTTETIEDATLLKGQSSVVREGEPGLARVRATVTYIDDMEREREVLSREIVREPVSKQVKVGSKLFVLNYGSGGSGSGTVSSNFIWPVPGMKGISAGWYGYAGHAAIDMRGNYGTPIIASAPGTVTYSGYTVWGYGRHIIINHGDGVQTLYAHNSQNAVRVGDRVEQGQVVGYVGSTGNSTGNHCHFEIRINGTQVNPMKYLP